VPGARAVLLAALAASALAAGCRAGAGETSERAGDDDPLAFAAARAGKVDNLEASVPPMCYTRTGGASNPCFVCHTASHGHNTRADLELQEEYSFSEVALENHWTNLFADRTAAIAAISDEEILRYVREDNYAPLGRALAPRKKKGYEGYVPDLDLARGFDEEGFARDESGWRAVRYKPFPGTFWPTNGSADDVFVRLPEPFRKTAAGEASRAVYELNLSLVEASVSADGGAEGAALDREIEPVDEALLGFDLDGDGQIRAGTTRIRRLPPTYAGAAASVRLVRGLYPQGTEFLHSVRYLDPEAPGFAAARMKELRYARKVLFLDRWAILRAYERAADEKDEGHTPVYTGSATSGLRSDLGWQLQGFIEDERGRLRLQTDEEHRHCMGCHAGIGVIVDGTFSLPRKVPGRAGWRPQDVRGILDVPQRGHAEPEVLTYLRRVGGGDELRDNDEMLARFFPGGLLDEREVLRGAPGGDRDLGFLVLPSRERALKLDKAYRALVKAQRFDRGRAANVRPVANVHARIENGSTELGKTGRVFRDGRLALDWAWKPEGAGPKAP
jgi:hypothetical protein